MKKRLSQRYFSIIGKNLSEVTEEEAGKIAASFEPKDEVEYASLITLLSFFDNKNDVNHAIQKHTFSVVSNIKSLIRDILRESRKTFFYPVNTLSALMDEYYEAFDIIINILEEIHNGRLFDAILTKDYENGDLIKLIYALSERVSDTTFPLRSASLSEAKNLFYKTSSKNQWARQILANSNMEESSNKIRQIEVILFTEEKKRMGLSFDGILSLSDDEVFEDRAFLYTILFVYKKTPYDLLKANSKRLRNSAMEIMAS